MTKSCWIAVGILLAAGLPSASAESGTQMAPQVAQTHRYAYLERDEARNVVGLACLTVANSRCGEINAGVRGIVAVQATAEAQVQIAALLAERDAAAAPRAVRFRVYVLDEKPSFQARSLPEPVERALRDVESVLGKKFALSDSAELRLNYQGSTTLGKDLRVEIKYHGSNDPKKLTVDVFRLYANGGKDGILDTSFGISIGETVAVGTMKTSTGTLITLVTAVD